MGTIYGAYESPMSDPDLNPADDGDAGCVGTTVRGYGDTMEWDVPCPRTPDMECHVCGRPVCGMHSRKSTKPGRGYQVNACPDCRAKYKSTAPQMQPDHGDVR